MIRTLHSPQCHACRPAEDAASLANPTPLSKNLLQVVSLCTRTQTEVMSRKAGPVTSRSSRLSSAALRIMNATRIVVQINLPAEYALLGFCVSLHLGVDAPRLKDSNQQSAALQIVTACWQCDAAHQQHVGPFATRQLIYMIVAGALVPRELEQLILQRLLTLRRAEPCVPCRKSS